MTCMSFTCGATLFAMEYIVEVLFSIDDFSSTLFLKLVLHLILVLAEVVIQFDNCVVLR